MLIREIIHARSRSRRWVYILCGVVVGSIAVVSVGMEGTPIAGVLFLPPVLFCIVQYLRPTLLLWAFLTLAFLVYTLEIVAHFKQLTIIDGMLFSSVGLIPFALLLWAWPRANLRA